MRLLDSFLVLVALTGLVFTAWWGMYQSPATAASLEARLLEKAQAALVDAGQDWAVVRMEGQKAVLSGSPPDDEAREAAIAAVAIADGPGGQILGGVTEVETQFDALQSVGALPDEARSQVYPENGRILVGHVSARMQLAGRAPSRIRVTDGS
ncbi:MAG: hypothetical protein AAFW65_04170 [Pseudomonadota bacterium]